MRSFRTSLLIVFLALVGITIASCGHVVSGMTPNSNEPLSVLPQAFPNSVVPRIYVASGCSGCFPSIGPAVLAYPGSASGNIAPAIKIAGSNTALGITRDVAFDSTGNLYVNTDYCSGGSCQRSCILTYAPGANGNAKPIRKICGSNTGLINCDTFGLAIDRNNNIYVSKHTFGSPPFDKIYEFRAGASGNVAPIRRLVGSSTGLDGTFGIAVDAAGRLYAANGYSGTITIYAAGASGNTAPIRTLHSYFSPSGIALDASDNIYVVDVGQAPGDGALLVFKRNTNGSYSESGFVGQLNDPDGVAVNGTGTTIYMAIDGTSVEESAISVYIHNSTGLHFSHKITGSNTGLAAPSGGALH